MLNAVLADDEPIIIKGLKKLIPWEELGVSIIGEAWTGKGLLELIDQHEPDLVITDISMPDGSGIDVIKAIQLRRLHTKVVFISAYQEFSYAKDAIAYGAVDYLVKPIDKVMLANAVTKAVTLLREENEEQSSKSKLEVYEKKDKKTQMEELFDRLTEGDIRSDEAERKLTLLDVEFPFPAYTVMAFGLDKQAEDGRWGEHEKRLVWFAVANVVEEMILQHWSGLIIRKADSLCAIVNHDSVQAMASLAEEMVQQISYYLKVSVSIGIGRPVPGLDELKDSWLTSIAALKSCYFTGGQRAIPWTPVPPIPGERPASDKKLHEIREAVVQALLSKDGQLLSRELEQLYALIAAMSQGRQESAVTAGYALLRELVEELQEVGIPFAESDTEQQAWLQPMHASASFEELKQFISRTVRGMLEQLQLAGGGKETHQMRVVKEYIELHYHENITLESMASMVYMNPYYFSSFFKKHTRQNFKQYVTEIRMKQAVKLLLHTDLMVYEIAGRVGYNNARQFSDMFKKRFGKLPQEYKTQRQ
ncbi:MAG: response regulatory protein [Paenibacillus sp.]|jgi:two-component system response regulator YesN|nr:response regulatory protein [Paenibacillus sp.]